MGGRKKEGGNRVPQASTAAAGLVNFRLVSHNGRHDAGYQ